MQKTDHDRMYDRGRAWTAGALFIVIVITLFAGGVVTSKNVGLSVPDWPTSFGYHMWGMPFSLWQGGAFYEHVHRVLASVAGCIVVGLMAWTWLKDSRRWVRGLIGWSFVLVVLQGFLGGLTVLLRLPTIVSVMHGVLAQIFLCLAILTVYTFSRQRINRIEHGDNDGDATIYRKAIIMAGLVFLQLVLAAYMRHDIKHQGGVAIPDFPTMAGHWIPSFDQAAVNWVNAWRQDAVNEHGANLVLGQPVTARQMLVHFAHRTVALLIVVTAAWLTGAVCKRYPTLDRPKRTVFAIDALVLMEVMLGMLVVWSMKGELITSLHVVTGALILGGSVWLVAQTKPIRKSA